jgi:hypothetical protein
VCVCILTLNEQSFYKINNDDPMSTMVNATILDNNTCTQYITKSKGIETMSHCVCDATISHKYIFNNTVQTFSKTITLKYKNIPMIGENREVSLYHKNRSPPVFHVHHYQYDNIDEANRKFVQSSGFLLGLFGGGLVISFILMCGCADINVHGNTSDLSESLAQRVALSPQRVTPLGSTKDNTCNTKIKNENNNNKKNI